MSENKKPVGRLEIIIAAIVTLCTAVAFPAYDRYIAKHEVSDETREAIHDEQMKVALEFPGEIKEKYKVDSARFYNRIRKLESDVRHLREQTKTYEDLIEGTQKQTDFNTKALSITNDALSEEMDRKKNACDWEYLETNGGDNWQIFNDYYESRIIYSVHLRSNCRAYYTPIFRDKIEIKK